MIAGKLQELPVGDSVEGATGGGGGGGSSWPPLQVPAASSLTLVTGDSYDLTLTDDADCGLLVDVGPPQAIGGGTQRFGYKPVTNGSLDWDFVIYFDGWVPREDYSNFCLGVREGSTGYWYRLAFHATNNIRVDRMANMANSAGGASVEVAYPTAASTFRWARIRHDGSTYRFYVGPNGKLWNEVFSIADNDLFTGTTGIQVGIGGGYYKGSGQHVLAGIRYWSLTGPGA